MTEPASRPEQAPPADLSGNQEAFLGALRTRLGRLPAKVPHPGHWNARASTVGPAESVVARFVRELAAVGGRAERVVRPEDLRAGLQRLGQEAGLRRVVREADPRWSEPPFAGWLGALTTCGLDLSVAGEDREPVAAADAGITWADWGVAETGSLVLATGPGRSQLVSLLPAVHVALLFRDRILATRAEVFGRLRTAAGQAGWPAKVVLITGPSRTADIESDLAVGVHGPRRVHVFVCG